MIKNYSTLKRGLMATLVVATLGVTLTGCGKTEEPDAAASPGAQTTSAPTTGTGAAPQSAPPASYQSKSYGGQVAKPE